MAETPFYNLPLDLPHAGRLADRLLQMIEKGLNSPDPTGEPIIDKAERLASILFPYFQSDENPVDTEGYRIRDEAAAVARDIVDDIEQLGIGYDRLGQCVRNLFECLELGKEGAEISLRAGENPNSLQRPY
jgi:hypothetical protein